MKFNFSSAEREILRHILSTIVVNAKTDAAITQSNRLLNQVQPNSLESNFKPPQITLLVVILEHGINVGQEHADKQKMVADMILLRDKIKGRVKQVHPVKPKLILEGK